MKLDHKTMLEALEETDGRGDVLSLPREELIGLAALSFELFAPIFYQLLKWFVNGDETPLENEYANAILERMKEVQRKNALRRKAFLIEQANRSAKGVEARRAKRTHGLPAGNPAITQPKPEPKLKPKQSLGSGGGVKAAASLPSPPPPTVTVTEARRIIQDLAPEITEDNYDPPAMEDYRKNYEFRLERDDLIVNRAAFMVNETNNPKTVDFMRKSCRNLERPLFTRAVFKMDQDLKEAGQGGSENPGAVLVARVKRLDEAVAAIRNAGGEP